MDGNGLIDYDDLTRFEVRYLDSTVIEYLIPDKMNCVRTSLH